MSERQLRSDVYLTLRSGGLPERFRAGTPIDALPAGVAERISNPSAWVDVEPVVVPVVEPVLVEAPVDPANPDDVDDLDDDEQFDDPDEIAPVVTNVAAGNLDEPVEPPRTGRAATDTAWRQYAAALGQVVPSDARRAEVIAQLSAAGLIESEG